MAVTMDAGIAMPGITRLQDSSGLNLTKRGYILSLLKIGKSAVARNIKAGLCFRLRTTLQAKRG